jgi:hypothetical protein
MGRWGFTVSPSTAAAEYLEFAFDRCYISSRHNKR